MAKRKKASLVVLGADFEVGTGVFADWADFGGGVADINVTTVAALPDGDLVALENDIVFDVIKEFKIAIFVFFLDGGDSFKFVGEFVVAFGASLFGELLIHIGPFVVFTGGGVF